MTKLIRRACLEKLQYGYRYKLCAPNNIKTTGVTPSLSVTVLITMKGKILNARAN